MHVVTTAGHVDHGKSTLVRALTGMEPDRWAEEQRRGLTLDLGFAWTTLPTNRTIAFVDVPGHERFVTTMMAGVGPVPAVLLVVAADKGWSAQTTEHVSILDSLGIRHGLLAVTRNDLADPGPAVADAQARLSHTTLAGIEAVTVSSTTGRGMAQLQAALDRLAMSLPTPRRDGRIRLFIDRSFTVRGSGTVVTGTLPSGTLSEHDRLMLVPSGTQVRVRSIQCLGREVAEAHGVARVAVNLRGTPVSKVRRGHVLVTPGAWHLSATADVRLLALDPGDLRGDIVFHVGSAAIPCRLRPLGEDVARVHLRQPLPLEPGDRAVLREPSSRLSTGLVVLDVDPPDLRRRGAARARADELALATGTPDTCREVARRGSMTRGELAERGILSSDEPVPAGLKTVGDHLVDPGSWERWKDALLSAVDWHADSSPLRPGLSLEGARAALRLPDLGIVKALVDDSAGALEMSGGLIGRPGLRPRFSEAQQKVLDDLCERLRVDPLDAPSAEEIESLGLNGDILSAAASAGMVLRLPGEVVLHPSAPDVAMEILVSMEQPFTLSEARQALGTTRKVAMPLLEFLDRSKRTIRVDSQRRKIRQGQPAT
ncbi:MAG: selenocysteine-specific translation elongation factor [Actinomycetota bacterium]|jgi:selenocysteine-specific elongation factor|nr:selenocysteine-specific translation elongation factor [Actinomycetota bacterium]